MLSVQITYVPLGAIISLKEPGKRFRYSETLFTPFPLLKGLCVCKGDHDLYPDTLLTLYSPGTLNCSPIEGRQRSLFETICK